MRGAARFGALAAAAVAVASCDGPGAMARVTLHLQDMPASHQGVALAGNPSFQVCAVFRRPVLSDAAVAEDPANGCPPWREGDTRRIAGWRAGTTDLEVTFEVPPSDGAGGAYDAVVVKAVRFVPCAAGAGAWSVAAGTLQGPLVLRAGDAVERSLSMVATPAPRPCAPP